MRRHEQATLEDLIPPEMVRLVLSDAGSLPLTLTETRQAVVLHLDLCSYTTMAATLPSVRLAKLMHAIFSAFDARLAELDAKRAGVFKMDTIGDAYIAAAFLSASEAEDAHARNVSICLCMEAIAGAMVSVIEGFGRDLKQEAVCLECRVGIDMGTVVAGMHGIAQVGAQVAGREGACEVGGWGVGGSGGGAQVWDRNLPNL